MKSLTQKLMLLVALVGLGLPCVAVAGSQQLRVFVDSVDMRGLVDQHGLTPGLELLIKVEWVSGQENHFLGYYPLQSETKEQSFAVSLPHGISDHTGHFQFSLLEDSRLIFKDNTQELDERCRGRAGCVFNLVTYADSLIENKKQRWLLHQYNTQFSESHWSLSVEQRKKLKGAEQQWEAAIADSATDVSVIHSDDLAAGLGYYPLYLTSHPLIREQLYYDVQMRVIID